MKKQFHFTDIIVGIFFTLFFLSLGIITVINFRPLYYIDIQFLNIPDTTGLSKQIIMDNYNALIDYCSPFFKGDLIFPTLTSSNSGLQHFIEVKNIFIMFYVLCPITLLILIGTVLYKRKKRDYSYLLVSSITMIVLPLIVLIGSIINFDTLFVIFHKIFFRNDYWLFDPVTDPIINLLPDTFFLHCALFIAAFIVIGSILLYTLYRKFTKKVIL